MTKEIEIIIKTDGTRENTGISIDGNDYKNIDEFSFSIKSGDVNGKPKLVMVQYEEGRGLFPASFFAGDFEKFNKKANKPKRFIGCNRKE